MRTNKKQYDPNLLAILNMLGLASSMGFMYCMIVLVHGSYFMETTRVVLYMVWFGICWLSVTVMKREDIFGAYALGIATIAITIYDLVSGFASLGGALLGTIVMIIIIDYTSIYTQHDGRVDTRLTN